MARREDFDFSHCRVSAETTADAAHFRVHFASAFIPDWRLSPDGFDPACEHVRDDFDSELQSVATTRFWRGKHVQFPRSRHRPIEQHADRLFDVVEELRAGDPFGSEASVECYFIEAWANEGQNVRVVRELVQNPRIGSNLKHASI